MMWDSYRFKTSGEPESKQQEFPFGGPKLQFLEDVQKVGGYVVGGPRGVTFYLPKKPNALQRFMVKHLLGWEWTDRV